MKHLALLTLLLIGLGSRSPAILVAQQPAPEVNYKLLGDLRYGATPRGVEVGSPSDRLLDLYLPASEAPEGGYPLFLFVHGGGFSGGAKRDTKLPYNRICKGMAERGYAVVSINYYLTMLHERQEGVSCGREMKAGVKEDDFHPLVRRAVQNASADARRTLEWLKAHAEEYQLNLNNLVVCGGSAGAMTVLHLAYFSKQRIVPIRGVVDLWGGADRIAKIKAPAPPMLIYHGDRDALIHVDYAYAFAEQLKAIGVPVELHILEGRGHAQYKYIAAERLDEINAFIDRLPDPVTRR